MQPMQSYHATGHFADAGGIGVFEALGQVHCSLGAGRVLGVCCAIPAANLGEIEGTSD